MSSMVPKIGCYVENKLELKKLFLLFTVFEQLQLEQNISFKQIDRNHDKVIKYRLKILEKRVNIQYHRLIRMLGFIKSVGSKAISSIPGFGSKTKLTTPTDFQLQQKLNQISSQILKSQPSQQFKVYQQLQSPQHADFNRNLRKIYQHQECTTETINAIIRFYTFLLTNSKNELVVCKLVSEPLVIELTKIVLQVEKINSKEEIVGSQEKVEVIQRESNNKQEEPKQIEQSLSQPAQQHSPSKLPSPTDSLHYLHQIDWDQVNAYKVALIRSYINCINPQTIKYMIIDNELPIFVNCVNGYKHYLSDGVEGTCLSNCILMILTKVNHNDEVCEIVFDEEHHSRALVRGFSEAMNQKREKLSKSISNQKSIKLHIFVKQVINKISLQLSKVLNTIQQQLQNSPTNNLPQLTLKPIRKLETNMEFIESNILFCVDLINSINNYNYTTKIKNNIGEAIENELIGKIMGFVVRNQQQQKKQDKKGQIPESFKKQSAFHLTIVKLIKFVLNLSITCQKQSMMIQFLNKHSPLILQTLITLNQHLFPIIKDNSTDVNLQIKPQTTHPYSKQFLTYMCDFSLILLKQTISPYSRLASRKRLQISHQVLELKENILSKIFILLEQLTKVQELKENVCYKCVRNLLLCVFYLTIKEDRCALSSQSKMTSQSSVPIQQKSLTLSNSPQKQSPPQTTNLALLLQFKYSILVLHKIFSQQFKQTFSQNKHWQFIVNNYQSLMREVPNTILSPQQSDKHCHYHNGHSYQQEDKVRDRIMVCEAVRNYRYMIIHETKLEERLIRLENIYHKHFMSPGWGYYPGQTINFASSEDYKIVCVGLLHNNSQQKLPIEILQDFQCLLISHKLSEHSYKLIANIRYKKIHSFLPQQKNIIRMKLIGIQELILQFSSTKVLDTFKQYLNENRNKTREKELKFISYYLNMYLKDTNLLIQEMYNQELVGLEEGEGDQKGEMMNGSNEKTSGIQGNSGNSGKKLSFDNIQVESFSMIDKDQIPEHHRQGTQSPTKQKQQEKRQELQNKVFEQQLKQVDPISTSVTINQAEKDRI